MKYDWNDILIVGDSFAEYRHREEDWPQHLACKLSGQKYDPNRLPRGEGYAGCAWWSTRKGLLRHLNEGKPKILVLTHTEGHRIPNEYDFAMNSWSLESPERMAPKEHKNRDKFLPEIFEAAKMYHKYLMIPEFHDWAQLRWFDEVDTITNDYGVERIVHAHLYQDRHNFPVFQKGVTIEETLMSIADDVKTGNWCYNHFTDENNIKFADRIYDIILNYAGDGKTATIGWNTP
jgi:hypothetical protein